MSTAMSRRSILQLALAPAFLARAQVNDLAPTVSRVHPGTDGAAQMEPDANGDVAVAEAPKQRPVRVGQKVGRNDPCPCGSGRKYKHCHGKLS